jgi:hypothetical protein
LILLAPSAWPQASVGSVSGTVRDQSGAVIPGATVVMVNTRTNVASTTKSNEVGYYFFQGAIAGSYKITVESAGMQKFEGLFNVQVEQRMVIDATLIPGQTTTSVEVKEITPMVTVDSATVRSAMERERIEQLPINGRSITALLSTVAGYEGTRVFGLRSDAAEWVIDGVVISNRRWSGAPSTLPNLDAIQEFTVDSNAVSAKFSRPVNVIMSSRSGSNQVHGTLFYTHRNNAIGLARSRTDVWTKAPQNIRNEYGGSLGGPVYIPKVYNGKERTFFFYSYEGRRSVSSSTQGWRVPTQAMRDGDFSGLIDSQGRLSALYDPWSTNTATWARQPFSHGGKLNVIPPSRQSPLAKYLFDITPLPTNGLNPLIDNNFWGLSPSKQINWQWNARLDHRFGDKDQVHLQLSDAYWWNHYPTTQGQTGFPMLNGVAGFEKNSNMMKTVGLTWLHSFSPTFFNETVASVKRSTWFGGEVEGTNWPEKLGLPNPFNTTRFPQILNTGLNGYQFVTNDTKRNHETYFVLDDNLTKIHGKHEFQFGAHVRRDRLNILPQQRYPAPQLNFSVGGATSLYDPKSTPANPISTPLTGHSLANMYLGLTSYGNNLSHNWYYLTGGEYATYFHDNFRATQRLTLNLGLRWELWPPYHDKRGTIAGFSREQRAIVLSQNLNTLYAIGATYPGLIKQYQDFGYKFINYDQAGLPADQVDSRSRNFGPRAGFAYKALDGKSSFVIRGGYSLSYFHVQLAQWLDNNRQSMPFAGWFSYDPNLSAQSPDGLPNYYMRSVPSVIAGVNSANVINTTTATGIARGSGSITYFDRNQPDSRSHTWNLSIEKEVATDMVARARYVGNRSTGLSQNYRYNDATPDVIWYLSTRQPLPTGAYSNVARRFYDQTSYGSIQEYRQTGWSNNNGIQLELERRFNKGYAFQLNYSLTNALVSGADMYETNNYIPGAVPAGYDERNSLLNYQRDTGVPQHRVKWNFLIDLPFGSGRLLGHNARGILEKVIGGWQLAGLGSLRTNHFTLPTDNWSFTGAPIEMYGYKYPIEDCRSGSCIPGYLWWNGYIPANQINSRDANGRPNGYMGVPANYKPAVAPLIPWGSTAMPVNAPSNTVVSQFWDTNTVWIPLNNSQTQRVNYNDNLHPWRNQHLPSVRQWGLDASLFKQVKIGEAVKIRFNADFFNVLNAPGNPNSVGSNGFLNTRNSGNSPRTLQLSLRVSF